MRGGDSISIEGAACCGGVIMVRRVWRGGSVTSRFGWPIPRIAKEASPREMSMFVETAKTSGFSRKGKGLTVQEGWRYYLLPYLQESSPVPCWMCVVVAVGKSVATPGNEQSKLIYSRLDVTIWDFRSLSNASAVDRDQLLHWVLWDAANSAGK
jgi:hypothetical protein